MSWWRRLLGSGPKQQSDGPRRRGKTDGPHMDVDLGAVKAYAQEWASTRRGVEGYVEPATNMTATTLVLIAHDGEWTRRGVGSLKAGFSVCRDLGLPVYDVNQIGYPSRMREWNRRQRGRQARRQPRQG